jgi:hypothetical protein
MEYWSVEIESIRVSCFELRVKYCKLNAETHDSQLVIRNTQRVKESITPTLQHSTTPKFLNLTGGHNNG